MMAGGNYRIWKGRLALSAAALIVISLLSVHSSAQTGSSRGGTFLPLGWDARGEAIGGAATLLVRDGAAAYWNPANLVFVRSAYVSAGAYRPVEGLTNLYSTATVAFGLMDTRVAPDSLVFVRRLAIALTASHLGLDLARGSAWNEGTAGLSAGFSFNAWNSIGASVRFLRSWTDLDDADSWGMAYDFGYVTRVRRNIWAGVMLRNMSSVIHYPEVDEELDGTVNFALSLEDLFGRISLEGDLVMKAGELNRVLAGAEI
ncbi:MAG TPA: hypothetical protein VLA34_00375, partial [Candidatus Krumholzibacterium sp.]|nr:hypothetical protein [Candidatus Krumholzibacterium sp.]